METFGIEKRKLQKITLAVIAALTLISLVLLIIIIAMSVGDNTTINNGDTKINLEFVDGKATEKQLQTGSLILANTGHPYPAPENFSTVNISEYRTSKDPSVPYFSANYPIFCMAADAIESTHDMIMALRSATGSTGITVSQAYGNSDYPADKDIHTGYTMVLTVDLKEDTSRVDTYFTHESNKDLYDWMNANAHKYGFVTRYPADKAEITGVSDYTYAYRYVGVAHATYMNENGLCLEEYIEYLKTNTSHKDTLTVKGADGKSYVVYYAECADVDTDIKLPKTPEESDELQYSYTVSGTNEGGVVITVKID